MTSIEDVGGQCLLDPQERTIRRVEVLHCPQNEQKILLNRFGECVKCRVFIAKENSVRLEARRKRDLELVFLA